MKQLLLVEAGSVNHSGIIATATALAANPSRCAIKLSNLGTNTLYVKFGTGATTSDFDFPLSPGTVNDDGKGASYESPELYIYNGIITVAGTSPRYVVMEVEG